MFILVEGNPVDGFTFTGPFEDSEDAIKEAEAGSNNGNWWITTLWAPSKKRDETESSSTNRWNSGEDDD